jgi:AcrR family transcriptional regulator
MQGIDMGTERATKPARGQTHGRVLDVALDLISKQGFAGTSTREISERLGFTKAALYYHFRTKEDLLAALIAPAMEYLTNMVADRSVSSAVEPRHELLVAYVDFVCLHEKLIRVLSQDPSVASQPAVLVSVPLYERLAQLISGEETPDARHRTMVRTALGGIRAAILYASPGDDRAVIRDAALVSACGAIGINHSGIWR